MMHLLEKKEPPPNRETAHCNQAMADSKSILRFNVADALLNPLLSQAGNGVLRLLVPEDGPLFHLLASHALFFFRQAPPLVARFDLIISAGRFGNVLFRRRSKFLVLALFQHRQAFVPVAFNRAEILSPSEVGALVVGLGLQGAASLLGAFEFLFYFLDLFLAVGDSGSEPRQIILIDLILDRFSFLTGALGIIQQCVGDVVPVRFHAVLLQALLSLASIDQFQDRKS